MYTTYTIEKIAADRQREAVAAAEQHRRARAARTAAKAEPQRSPATAPVRIRRRRHWFGLAVAGR